MRKININNLKVDNFKKSILDNLTLFWHYIKYVVRQFFNDNCFESASALTYTTLLSIVPFMAVTVFIMKGVPYFQELWNGTQQFIFSHFVPATGREVQYYLQEFIKNTGQLTVIGIIFLMLSAMILIYTIEQTFNRIWGVKASRGILSSFLLYWATLTLLPILMGLSFGFSSYLWSLPFWQNATGKLGIQHYILTVIPFILSWLSFTLIYILIPNCQVRRLHAFVIAFFVAVAFEISKRIFASYVTGINLNALLYGAFATIPFFLLWIYICWLIILGGAQMVNALGFYKFKASDSSEARFIQSYKWLIILWQAQLTGQELSADQLFSIEGKMTATEPYRQLQKLEETNWIKRTASGNYVLARDLSDVTFYDFYQSLPWRLPRSHSLVAENDKYMAVLKAQVLQVEQCINQAVQHSLKQSFIVENLSQ